MNAIFDALNSALPPEFSRIFYLILLTYIAYKVSRIYDMLERAIDQAGRDRRKALGDASDALEEVVTRKRSNRKE